MRRLVLAFFIIFFTFTSSCDALPQDQGDYKKYMQIWEEKRELASGYLLKAEKSFKQGDELAGCSFQQKASILGIDATESLIRAIEISGVQKDFKDLESGLNKWKELGDFC